ncbi:glycosyltransferase family 25 protein [Phyllobacterium leguminum]|uniref:GR25 family glycosyltransferase involved in LPS biosynthesis n=1 Tax=Phyllobacterium leguminum TaxID=314237 RepID=A0A318T2V1_9HYPH|nr:glycosyltransferase family 25 protein [Phyllobacterium leguminum]PYE88199.1 GR25 family glycosyltransferase involved in LPS biosynthesis [Phyllobacterium leguminum]
MKSDAIKAFIIHLDRATDRRGQVEKLIAELPIPAEIIDAVDGRRLGQAEIERVYRRHLHKPPYPFRLSINEIACFLSHRKAWQAIVDQNLAAGLVIEDDVALNSDFADAWNAARAYLEPSQFIRLPFRPGKETGPERFRKEGTRIIEPIPVGLGMVAQLVGRDAAKQLLAVTKQFDRPVDTLMQMSWVTGVNPLSVHPGGVEEVSAHLGGSTLKQKRSVMHRLSREILRPIYRMRIRSLSRKHGKRPA